MATVAEIKAFQAATNAWDRHHVPDLLAPIAVDGTFGRVPARSLTHRVPLRAFWYFGGGLPTIRQWDTHITDEAIAHLTRWFRHPDEFYRYHRGAKKIGEDRVAAERERRKPHPSNGLVDFDGAHVATWIGTELNRVRNYGVDFTIPDKTFGGFRTNEQQWWLYTHDPPPVAYPGTSRHEEKVWDGGAADVSNYYAVGEALRQLGSDLRQNAPDADPVHMSSLHYHNRTGSY